MAIRRRYSDNERAAALAALAANSGNIPRTARQLGIPDRTLRQWHNGVRHPEVVQLSEQKKGPLADQLEVLAWKLAEALPDKIAKASLQQTAVTFGIVVEKMRLLRDKPTSISASEFPFDLGKLSDEQLDQLDAILAAAGLPPAPRTGAVPA